MIAVPGGPPDVEEDVTFACDAFPAGIPASIIENRRDHRKPYPGDRGILFEPRESFEAA